MNLLDSLGIAASLLMIFAEVVWIGLAFDRRRDRASARFDETFVTPAKRRAARRRP